MKIGDTVKIVVGPGGLFVGRTGRVFRIVEWKNRTDIGVMFEDNGPGSGRPLPYWFTPDEVVLAGGSEIDANDRRRSTAGG